MRLSEATVAIYGLGLMGGSLALALRGKCRHVVGVGRRPEAARKAVDVGAVDSSTCNLAAAAAHADIVVLATPVRDIVATIPLAAEAMRPGALLMDLGSTKREVVAAMDSVPHEILAVGGHPMCGKEAGGLDSADDTLFRGATFVLTPTARTTGEALALATELAEAAGACPLVLDAERHDRAVAVVSHLPYLLAATLVHAEAQSHLQDPVVQALAATGFRDTTRLASSQVDMMLDILLTNRDAVTRVLNLFEASLADMRAALRDPQALRKWMEQAQAERARVFA
jgi:prephenate dehydrogenase